MKTIDKYIIIVDDVIKSGAEDWNTLECEYDIVRGHCKKHDIDPSEISIYKRVDYKTVTTIEEI